MADADTRLPAGEAEGHVRLGKDQAKALLDLNAQKEEGMAVAMPFQIRM